MSKPRLIPIAACTLAAFFAATSAASAFSDPACDVYGNQFGLYDVSIHTRDNRVAHGSSRVSGDGLACGSEIEWPSLGSDSLFFRADVQVANGVEINRTAGIEQDAFAGTANVSILTYAFHDPHWESSAIAVLSVDNSQGTDCPVDAIACYKGVTPWYTLNGHNWSWVTESSNGKYALTIGRFYNDDTREDAGLTHIKAFSVCPNAGNPGSLACGDASKPWLQRNGDQSVFPEPTCSNGNGIYTVTATTKGGETTDPATVCVKWLPVARRHHRTERRRIWP